MTQFLTLTALLYIAALVCAAIAAYYPELEHITTTFNTTLIVQSSTGGAVGYSSSSSSGEPIPSLSSSSSVDSSAFTDDNTLLPVDNSNQFFIYSDSNSSFEITYKYGPFRACIVSSIDDHDETDCGYIKTDCSVDINMNPVNLLTDSPSLNATFSINECARFNSMRGTLVGGIILAAFSALSALLTFCKVCRAGDPHLVRESYTTFTCTSFILSTLTLGSFLTAFVIGFMRNASTDDDSSAKELYDDFKSRGVSLWLMATSVGLSFVSLLTWVISVCCVTRPRTRPTARATANTPFISARSSRPQYQSHNTAASQYV